MGPHIDGYGCAFVAVYAAMTAGVLRMCTSWPWWGIVGTAAVGAWLLCMLPGVFFFAAERVGDRRRGFRRGVAKWRKR
jgi:hypothetical protein